MMPAEKPTLYVANESPGVLRDIQDNHASGYIKLFRSIRKHWLWSDADRLKWWLDIILECNHDDKKVLIGGTLIECRRGQSINSLQTWGKRWRIDKSAVRRFFQLLENDGMILTENVSKTTRLTVCNYGTYNDKRNADETQTKRRRNAGDTKQEVQELKEESNDQKPLTPKQFYENQIAENAGAEQIEKYKALVAYLFGENDEDIKFVNVLKLEQQLTYKQYSTLRTKWLQQGVDLRDILRSMENDKKAIKDKSSVYLTINNWAGIRSDRKK